MNKASNFLNNKIILMIIILLSLLSTTVMASSTVVNEINYTYTINSEARTDTINNSGIILVYNLKEGTMPHAINNSGINIDVMPSTLPPNVTDTHNIFNLQELTSELIWRALSLVLNNSYATVRLNELIDLTTLTELNLDNNVNLSNNYVKLNATALPILNKSAIITIKNITYSTIRILKDNKDCSDCQLITYQDNETQFQTNGFATYSISEETNPTATIKISTSTIIINATLDITGKAYNQTYPSNVEINIGGDGIIEFENIGQLNTTNKTINFAESINNITSTCNCPTCNLTNNNLTCLIGITITSTTQGTIQLENLNLTQQVNNYTLATNISQSLLDLDDLFYDENNDSLTYNLLFKPENDLQTTMLYSSFDANYTDYNGETGNNNSLTLTNGLFGKGTLINSSGNLSYNSNQNYFAIIGTLEMWVIPQWNGTDNNEHVFFEMNTTSGSENEMKLFKAGNNNLTFEVTDNDNNNYRITYNISSWKQNNPHHIAATWESNDMNLWIDGTKVATLDSATMPLDTSENIFIGSTTDNRFDANAIIDELKISNEIKTDFYNVSEINYSINNDNIITISTNNYNKTKYARLTANDGQYLTYSNEFEILVNASILIGEELPNTAPVIEYVNITASVTPIEAETTYTYVNFTVTDLDGVEDINYSSANITIKSGATTKSNNCSATDINSTTTEFRCNVTMNYYDTPGVWTINASVKDNSNMQAENTTLTMTYNQLYSITLNTNSINIGTQYQGIQNINVTPQIVNNTGNMPYSYLNLIAYNLVSGSNMISVGNFSINITASPTYTGQKLTNNTPINIIGSSLEINNYKRLYIYLNIPSNIRAGQYNSSSQWKIEAIE